MEDLQRFAAVTAVCAGRKILKKLVFSKPDDASLGKISASLLIIGGRTAVQFETTHAGGKILHENIALSADGTTSEVSDELAKKVEFLGRQYSQINLVTAVGECAFMRSRKGKIALMGLAKIEVALDSATDIGKTEIKSHNREKNYILSGTESFLQGLEISDKSGRVHDKKRSKFRQINRFLELVRDVEDKLPKTGTIHIADLCCGKSYLSYAVYYYFTEIKKRDVAMTGIDLKSDVIGYCARLADKLHFDNLHFICRDIGKFEPETVPHMVISLHACDIATDIVLEKAAEWKAGLILSTPCCHHELNHTIDCPELDFIAEYSMLRQKMCDAATDALRLLRLKARGYECEALELIDPEDTPKNIMLRAVRRRKFAPEDERLLKEKFNKSVDYLTKSDMNLTGIKHI